MNFGDYSGEYKSKVFTVLMSFFDVDIEELARLTGFTESHLEGILKQDNLDKRIGKQILSVLNLTNNDYDWIYTVISEIAFDRTQRIRKLDEIRFKQRQLKLEKERVKKDNGKERESSSKKIKSNRSKSEGQSTKERNSTEEGSNKKRDKNKQEGVSKDRNSKERQVNSEKGDKVPQEGSKGSKASKESGQKVRKVIKKRKG